MSQQKPLMKPNGGCQLGNYLGQSLLLETPKPMLLQSN